LWFLGYPEAALADAEHALEDARQIGQAATLMFILQWASLAQLLCGNYAPADVLGGELVALSEQKGSTFWKTIGGIVQGCVLALTGRAVDAVGLITSGLSAYRSMGSSLLVPFYSSCLARAYADLGKFDRAWHCIGEAMTAVETGKERWFEAEVHRTAGEIALKAPEPDATKGQIYFERALAVARGQQAKSWELRAAMSMAQLWRDQGKSDDARDLLVPIHGRFTEGFATLDLKKARALLDELGCF
jgi:predicted ATPase